MERGFFEKVNCARADNCFVEKGTFQPLNTFSNLGYVIIAVAILASRRRGLPQFQKILLGAIVLFMGLSSAYYHATMTFLGQVLDLFGMYMLASFILFYALMRLRQWSNQKFLVAFLLLLVPLLAVVLFWPAIRNYAFAASLALGLIAEFIAGKKDQLDWRVLLASLVSLVVAWLAF